AERGGNGGDRQAYAAGFADRQSTAGAQVGLKVGLKAGLMNTQKGRSASTNVAANGARIPLLGLGTWELRGRACARLVEQALRLGYRHIDTAEMYDNEREVGEGLHASGIKRGDVFVTTKIWPSHFAPRDLERAARECLARLRLREVDLLLLHWPNPQIPLS